MNDLNEFRWTYFHDFGVRHGHWLTRLVRQRPRAFRCTDCCGHELSPLAENVERAAFADALRASLQHRPVA